jgi:hypothetical protein
MKSSENSRNLTTRLYAVPENRSDVSAIIMAED